MSRSRSWQPRESVAWSGGESLSAARVHRRGARARAPLANGAAALVLALLLAACSGSGRLPAPPLPDPKVLDAIAAHEASRAFDRQFFARVAGDPSPHVRARAARALGRLRLPSAAPLLLEMVRAAGDDKSVLAEAAFALGQIGDGSALDDLVALTRHGSERVRARAVEAVGKLRFEGGDDTASAERAVQALRDSLGDASPLVCGRAALALGRRGAVAAVPDLAARLDASESTEVRWRAAAALAAIEDARTLPPLRAVITDPDPWVSAFAARGMAHPPDAESLPAVAALLDHPHADPIARVFGYIALEVLRKGPAAEPEGAGERPRPVADETIVATREILLRRLHLERDPHLLESLARALVAGGGDIERPFLEALAEHRSAAVRRAALGGLGAVAGAEAIPFLERRAAAERGFERAAAVRAWGDCGGEAVEPLVRALGDPDVRVRCAAVEALAAAGGDRAWQAVRDATLDEDLAVRGTALDAIGTGRPEGWAETLVARSRDCLGRDYWECRKIILEKLADDPARVAPLARAALEDPSVGVRWVARRVLGVTDDPVPSTQFRTPSYPLLRSEQLVAQELPQLIVDTSRGRVVVELDLEAAPHHVSNIVHLARQGFYDGLTIHRVVPAWVVQGGDPRGDGWGDGGVSLPEEINPRPFLRGTVGMPTAGYDTGGCQFFITLRPAPRLDGAYTAFGRVVLGMEVIDRLEVGDRIIAIRVDEHRFRPTPGSPTAGGSAGDAARAARSRAETSGASNPRHGQGG